MKGLIDFLAAAPAAVRRQLEEVSFGRRAPILWEGMENSAVYILLEGDAEGYLQGGPGAGVAGVSLLRPQPLRRV